MKGQSQISASHGNIEYFQIPKLLITSNKAGINRGQNNL